MNVVLSIAFSFHPNIAVHLVLLTIARKEVIFHPLCVLCLASAPRFSEKIRLLMHQETVPQIQGRSDSERASSRGSASSTSWQDCAWPARRPCTRPHHTEKCDDCASPCVGSCLPTQSHSSCR